MNSYYVPDATPGTGDAHGRTCPYLPGYYVQHLFCILGSLPQLCTLEGGVCFLSCAPCIRIAYVEGLLKPDSWFPPPEFLIQI